MAINRGPSITKDGLVLLYDVANIKSFKGESTTNLLPYPEDIAGSDWRREGWGGIITENYGISPDGTQTSTRIKWNGGYFYRLSYSSPVISGLISGATVSFSCYVKSVSAQPGRGIGLWSYNAGGIVASSNQEIGNFWTRVSLTYTITQSTESQFAIMLSGQPSNIFQGDIEVWHPQLEFKNHPTKYVNGTRVNNSGEGLFDLMKNFNGTLNGAIQVDNVLRFNNNSITTTCNEQFQDFSVCIWFKDNGSPQYGRLLDKSYISGFWLGRNYINPNSWGGGIKENGDPYGIFLPLVDGEWHYLVSKREGNIHTLYGDGVKYTNSNIVSNTLLDNTSISVGNWAGNQYFIGDIGIIQVYNRGLSEYEAVSNFNAMKNRYNIPDTQIENGLMLYLDAGNIESYLSGNIWYDLSGNKRNGTLTNGASYNDRNNGVISLDGANDYVRINLSESITLTSITYDTWVRATFLDGNWRTIVDLNNDTFLLAISGNTLTTYNPTFLTNFTLTEDVWYNCVISHNLGEPWYFYVNGVLIYTSTNNSNSVTFDKIGIGAGLTSLTTADEFWKGDIAVVKIYNRGLSLTEILRNYNEKRYKFV